MVAGWFSNPKQTSTFINSIFENALCLLKNVQYFLWKILFITILKTLHAIEQSVASFIDLVSNKVAAILSNLIAEICLFPFICFF